MQAVTTLAAVAIEGVDQFVDHRISIALPGGLYNDVTLAVERVGIEQQMTTDLPEGTRLLDGYPSAEATFTLSGLVDPTDESKTAAWLFGPYSLTSPLYRKDAFRCPVTIDLGVYPDGGGSPEFIRKFTGYVDRYTVAVDGSVEFTCIDRRSDLRNITALPPVVTAPPFNAGLTSEFAIDALLRQSTAKSVGGFISTWPRQRPQCLLAAGMRASTWPEIGQLVTTSSQPRPSFRPGVFGSALAAPAAVLGGGLGALSYQLSSPIGTTVFVEFWCYGLFFPTYVGLHSAGSLALGLPLMLLQVQSTGITVTPGPQLGGPAFTWSFTPTGTPHYVSFALTLPAAGGTAWSVTATCDTTTQSGGGTFTTARTADPWSFATVNAQSGTIEALQITAEAAPASNYGYTPTAVLDPSANAMQVMPAVEGDPWQALQQIAHAELGDAGFDEWGVFRFYNRQRLRSGTSVRDITSRTSLKTFGFDNSAASVINRAQVGYTSWTFAATRSIVYSLDTARRIPRYTTVPIVVKLETLAANVDTSITVLPNNSTTTTTSNYRLSIDQAGTTEHPGGVTMTVVQTGADQITIFARNQSGTDAWTVSPANYTDITVGTPLLRLAAVPVTPDNEVLADYQYPSATNGGAASSRFGEVAYQLTGNPWLQDADTASQLTQDIVNASYTPIPNLTGVEIVPDPRLQIADRGHLLDQDVTGLDEFAQIFGISTTFEAGQYGMSLDMRTLGPPGAWLLDVPGRSELGDGTPGNPGTAYLY